MGTGVAVAALVVSVLSSVEEARQTSVAAGERREGIAVTAAEEQAQLATQRRKEIREKRVRAATIEQASANTGVTGSSGELGALSILSTNIAVNRANIARQVGTAGALTSTAQNVVRAQFKSQIAGGIGSISRSIFSASSFSGKAGSGSFDSSADIIGAPTNSPNIFGDLA